MSSNDNNSSNPSLPIHQMRKEIKHMVKECLTTEEDIERTKIVFSEFMKDQETWNLLILTCCPNWNKEEFQNTSPEDFELFKKIVFEEIDSWEPQGDNI